MCVLVYAAPPSYYARERAPPPKDGPCSCCSPSCACDYTLPAFYSLPERVRSLARVIPARTVRPASFSAELEATAVVSPHTQCPSGRRRRHRRCRVSRPGRRYPSLRVPRARARSTVTDTDADYTTTPAAPGFFTILALVSCAAVSPSPTCAPAAAGAGQKVFCCSCC